jgi:GNAT superfamily N-acetyltransferase
VRVLRPERLSAAHDVTQFSNGAHLELDRWLKERALESEGLSARTYVICDIHNPKRVAGYYTITSAMEERPALPSAKLRRGMPNHVPFMLIARLAVDSSFHGYGIGTDLLKHALVQCMAASEIVGARGVIVHAIDEVAAEFYRHHGFVDSAIGKLVLLMPMEKVRADVIR